MPKKQPKKQPKKRPTKRPTKPKVNTQTKTIKSSNKRNILAGVIGAGGLLALGGGAAMLYRGKSRTQTERVEQVTKAVKVSSETKGETKAKQKLKDGLCTDNENLIIKPFLRCESKYITDKVLGQGKDGLVFETCLGSGQAKQCNFVTKIMTNPGFFCNELKSYSILERSRSGMTPKVKDAYVCEHSDGSRKYCIVMTKIKQTLTQFLISKVDKVDENGNKVVKLDINIAHNIVNRFRYLYLRLVKMNVPYIDWHLDNIMVDQDDKLLLIDFSKDASSFNLVERFNVLISNLLWFIVMMARGGIPEGVWNVLLEAQAGTIYSSHVQDLSEGYTLFKSIYGDPLDCHNYGRLDWIEQEAYFEKIRTSWGKPIY